MQIVDQFDVEIQTETAVPISDKLPGLLVAAAVATLVEQQVSPPAALTLLLTDDAILQQMNRDYLGIDAPTDVLSFPTGDALPGMEGSGMDRYLGDIAISVPQAAGQATAAGHTLEDELQLLTVHGVLHLVGHDHAEAPEKATMWAAQAAILSRLGVDIALPSGDE
jgi:probable rRNA maturation factor